MKTLFTVALCALSLTAFAQQTLFSIPSVDSLIQLPDAKRGYDYQCDGLATAGDGDCATGVYRYFSSSTATTNLYPGVFTPISGTTSGRWINVNPGVINYTIQVATNSTSIAKAAGKVRFSVDGVTTTLVVTDSLIDSTNVIILATPNRIDATATQIAATPAVGSFTLTLNATNTATLNVSWYLIK